MARRMICFPFGRHGRRLAGAGVRSVIGDAVDLRIEAEATYDGKAGDDATDTPPSSSTAEPTP